MRRVLVVSAAFLLTIGCGGDDGDAGGGDALGDDPTAAECLAAARTVLDRFEVPGDVDTSDGLDDDERAAVDEAFEEAAEGYFDPNDDDHPCAAAVEAAPPEQVAEAFAGLPDDKLAVLGASAEVQFEAIEGEL